MMVAAVTLGILTVTDQVTVLWLLALTFVISIGGTMNMPPWTALTPEVVFHPRAARAGGGAQLGVGQRRAVARSGHRRPDHRRRRARGGLPRERGVVPRRDRRVLVAWRRQPPVTGLPAEHIRAAIRSGLRYVRNSPPLLVGLGRLGGVCLFTAALPALLPILARERMGVSAGQFGLLEASLGVGAVSMALVLPNIRKRVGPDGVLLVGCILAGAGLAIAAAATGVTLACVGLFVVGAGQIDRDDDDLRRLPGGAPELGPGSWAGGGDARRVDRDVAGLDRLGCLRVGHQPVGLARGGGRRPGDLRPPAGADRQGGADGGR